ncbi:unnamed protein product [Danaus chrysippus]|uniref:(African queen) hypothetical protein n=1 Tax=Danaus chrysippus TaxID=151541 RepID=A0A8J2QXC1_9NEOP|nr:unnamed protein product [Danaus chrysippus]
MKTSLYYTLSLACAINLSNSRNVEAGLNGHVGHVPWIPSANTHRRAIQRTPINTGTRVGTSRWPFLFPVPGLKSWNILWHTLWDGVNREKPPCKYFHPPQHLKDQLLINGRNHLALKNALMQQMGLTPGQVLPGQVPAVVSPSSI